MSESASQDHIPGVVPKPPGTREFTVRAVITGIVVAAIMGASYPYVVLKLGFGPNVSVVAAFFGYLFLGILFRNFNRWENNIVQTAGTSAAQTAFMCIILAAFDLVSQNDRLNYSFAPSTLQTFVWLTAASVLGLLLAVPLRKHYVVEEQLTYADGVAAAETVIVLDARGQEAKRAALALFMATLVSALVWLLTTKWSGEIVGFTTSVTKDFGGIKLEVLEYTHLVPEVIFPTMFGLTAGTAGAGFSVSVLAVGSGMIVGNRINVSMAIGATIAWIIAPKILYPGIIASEGRGDILFWVMWPGIGILISSGITALFLKWRTLKRTFATMSETSLDRDEFPLKWVAIGVGFASVALVVIQSAMFDLPIWAALIAILLSVPLMLVGLRVLGETNWGPISQLTNLMQAVFAGILPGNVTANLVASGTTGTVAVQSEAIMQDYKAGHIIGSTPRFLTYSQLIAAPIGAAAVALSYPALRNLYGIGGEHGMPAPGSQRIARFAQILNDGIDALPKYALLFLVIGAVLGIVITLLETRWRKYLPSPTGLGIGMVVPGAVVFSMVLGGILLSLWRLVDRRRADALAMPLASGLIAGEALGAVVIPVLVAIGVLSA